MTQSWQERNTVPCKPCDPHENGLKLTRVFSYGELTEKHAVTYVAGGASQNAARGAAVCKPLEVNSTVLTKAIPWC
jgi:hypothetical protein